MKEHQTSSSLYLHDDEEVKDQDEGDQERSGDLVARQEAAVQVIPPDPVRTDDQNHHRRQRDQHRPDKHTQRRLFCSPGPHLFDQTCEILLQFKMW